jgi:hypothetical protein
VALGDIHPRDGARGEVLQDGELLHQGLEVVPRRLLRGLRGGGGSAGRCSSLLRVTRGTA